MTKQEYREAEQRFEKTYDKSLLSHDDEEYDSLREYEFSILRHEDEYEYGGYDDSYEGASVGHFNE